MNRLFEIEEPTASNWLMTGTIWPTHYGTENTYYTDEFGTEFFCKNYPPYEHQQTTVHQNDSKQPATTP